MVMDIYPECHICSMTRLFPEHALVAIFVCSLSLHYFLQFLVSGGPRCNSLISYTLNYLIQQLHLCGSLTGRSAASKHFPAYTQLFHRTTIATNRPTLQASIPEHASSGRSRRASRSFLLKDAIHCLRRYLVRIKKRRKSSSSQRKR